MAISRRFRVRHVDVFPLEAYLLGEIAPLYDFEKSTKEDKVQERDKDTDLLMWAATVVDPDPEAAKKAKTVTVKIAAQVQPVPPEALPGLPFRPVVFEGLTASPYIEETGSGDKKFHRIAWSYRAEGITGPKATAPKAVAS